MLKASENPPIIWPEDKSIKDFEGPLWVAHTKSRNEKALAQNLISKSVEYFLPMSWKVRHQRGRKVKSLIPLFSGYLFFSGGENQRLEVLKTNRVANIIPVRNKDKLIVELSPIEQALLAGAHLTPHQYIQAGQRCRVIAGPLMGLVGIVLRAKTSARLVLQVDILGQAASVEVDLDSIELID